MFALNEIKYLLLRINGLKYIWSLEKNDLESFSKTFPILEKIKFLEYIKSKFRKSKCLGNLIMKRIGIVIQRKIKSTKYLEIEEAIPGRSNIEKRILNIHIPKQINPKNFQVKNFIPENFFFRC